MQLWPGAALDQGEFARCLRQRNAFLKAGGHDDVTLGVWDKRLAQSAGKVMSRRARARAILVPAMAGAYKDIAGVESGVDMTYTPEWCGPIDDRIPAGEYEAFLSAALEERRRIDRERRFTTVGPHRDEPTLLLEGYDSRVHGSQGEQRTLALAIRLASHRAVTEHVGRPPVLLLDDVFSELDRARAEALSSALPATQTFITSARPEDVPIPGHSWEVGDGKVTG